MEREIGLTVLGAVGWDSVDLDRRVNRELEELNGFLLLSASVCNTIMIKEERKSAGQLVRQRFVFYPLSRFPEWVLSVPIA